MRKGYTARKARQERALERLIPLRAAYRAWVEENPKALETRDKLSKIESVVNNTESNLARGI